MKKHASVVARIDKHPGSLSNRDSRAQNALQAHCQPAQEDRASLSTPLPPALLRQQEPPPLPSPNRLPRPLIGSSPGAIETRDSPATAALLLTTRQSPRDNGLQSKRSVFSNPQAHPPKATPPPRPRTPLPPPRNPRHRPPPRAPTRRPSQTQPPLRRPPPPLLVHHRPQLRLQPLARDPRRRLATCPRPLQLQAPPNPPRQPA